MHDEGCVITRDKDIGLRKIARDKQSLVICSRWKQKIADDDDTFNIPRQQVNHSRDSSFDDLL